MGVRPDRRRPAPWVAVIVVVAAVALPPAASADTYVVNKFGDNKLDGCTASHCTLREAVLAAHNRDGDDKIKLPSTNKAYRLTRSNNLPTPDENKGDLDHGTMFTIGNGLTVVHPGGGRATINAKNGDDRVFESLGRLTLRKLILRGGDAVSGPLDAGGAVFGEGLVLLDRTRIVNNHADAPGGGVYMADGNLFARRSLIKGNSASVGGGVATSADGTFAIVRSTISDNRAAVGGGLGARSDGVGGGGNFIRYSTIDNNTAEHFGGGLFFNAHHLFTYNSTFAHNRANDEGGGIYADFAAGGQLYANMITVANNRADADNANSTDGAGGGIYVPGGGSLVVEIANSLIVKNRTTGGAISECESSSPPEITSVGGNLITSTANGCNQMDAPEDLLDPDPRTGKLKNRGGPTKTISLKAGSPAIGQADSAPTRPDDQRGQARDGNPDIGAFER